MDLALHTSYKLSDFYRRREHWNTLHNLCRAFQRRRDSYLAQAIATDVDRYEEFVRVHGEPDPRRAEPPALIEVDLQASLLMSLVDIGRASLYYLSSNRGKRTKPYNGKPLPRPRTAAHDFKSRKAREVYKHLQEVLVFVPEERFHATVAAAKARGEVR